MTGRLWHHPSQTELLIAKVREVRAQGRVLELPEIMHLGFAQHGARIKEIRSKYKGTPVEEAARCYEPVGRRIERTVILGPEAVFGEQDDIVTPLGAVAAKVHEGDPGSQVEGHVPVIGAVDEDERATTRFPEVLSPACIIRPCCPFWLTNSSGKPAGLN